MTIGTIPLPEYSEKKRRGKEENFDRYTEIFINFLPRISISFDFPPGTSVEFMNVSLFGNSMIFRFSGNFP